VAERTQDPRPVPRPNEPNDFGPLDRTNPSRRKVAPRDEAIPPPHDRRDGSPTRKCEFTCLRGPWTGRIHQGGCAGHHHSRHPIRSRRSSHPGEGRGVAISPLYSARCGWIEHTILIREALNVPSKREFVPIHWTWELRGRAFVFTRVRTAGFGTITVMTKDVKCRDTDSIDFIIASPRHFSCTEAAKVQPEAADPPAHDAFTRLLHRLEPDPETLWPEARPLQEHGVRLSDFVFGFLVASATQPRYPRPTVPFGSDFSAIRVRLGFWFL